MSRRAFRPGFTLIELLVGSSIMLGVVVGALALFSRSNQVSADQQQFVELQQDVRGAMYYLARDIRMAGAGIPESAWASALDGVDNEDTGTSETPDRLRILGNIENPLFLRITNYSGASANVTIEDYSLERSGYPDSFYPGKVVMVLPSPSSGCNGFAIREITGVRHNNPGTNEGFQFSPKAFSELNPRHGLRGVCADADYFDGGSIFLMDMREYWLDVTGSVSGLTAGTNGYIGVAGVLYMTLNGVHYPLAQSIETIQFQYNGDFDGDADGRLDGFHDWSSSWTDEQIARIREVRIQILGRTRDAFATVNRVPAPSLHLYRRPALANTAAASVDDWHKRFLLESSSAVRNLAMNLYNTGTR